VRVVGSHKACYSALSAIPQEKRIISCSFFLFSSFSHFRSTDNLQQLQQQEGLEAELDVELEVHGSEKASVWRLLGVRMVLLPYTLTKVPPTPLLCDLQNCH